ncbi:MAG: MFS transporter [Alphaproteobacteria bacterium]|nr:MFS transporter [Alphaproteobacteria bacterium]
MSAPDTSAAALERRTMAKVMWRLPALMALMFLVNNIDRVNVSFAALTMNRDLGLSPLAYAWGAGIFFWAYFAFEVPSNVILARMGARRWIARIMISWGLVSGAMALVTGQTSFLILRFLLGAAEAGFIPGLLYYITRWFPQRYRARATAIFFLSAPVGNAVAGLLAVPLLSLDGWLGLAGWQWMFVAEAIPALALGAWVLFRLPERPRDAKWLTREECAWLEGAADQQVAKHPPALEQVKAVFNRRVGLLSLAYFGRNCAMYGVSLFLPLMLQAAGLSNAQVSYVATIPFLIAGLGAVAWAASSDRFSERHGHTIGAMVLAACGLALAAALGPSWGALIAVSLAAVGLYGQAVTFWSLPPMMLNAGTIAAGLAAINAVGNLGGFIGPYVVGKAATDTGNYGMALYLLAGAAAASALVSLVIWRLKWDRPAQGVI